MIFTRLMALSHFSCFQTKGVDFKYLQKIIGDTMLNDFFSRLLPGLIVKNVEQDDEQVILEAQPIHLTALCPSCHT
ncbi:MAG TPA: hypothetical protein P5280_01285, partial [Cyclobacteriaceae bacterium]|nr:hypothetical protein [Cyclobacteriaceae bacterium]